MAYNALKRIFGETKLELKLLFLFGVSLLVIIATAFWWQGQRTTTLVYEKNQSAGSLLVDQFMRDLKEQGYGPRLIGAIEKGKRLPRQPAVTVETYAWFIKHAADIHPDAYGVVICDEAHTALGEKTSAAIRSLDEPIYVGMTATEELIAKQV